MEIISYFFAIFIGPIIWWYLNRWCFDIDKQLSFQKKQIRLLIEIARKQGVSDEDIETIIKEK